MADRAKPTPNKVSLGKNWVALVEQAEKENQVQVQSRLSGYAAPMIWGPDVVIGSHIGSVTYTISYEAVGDTVVLGRVTYFKGSGSGSKVTEEFRDETTITTSNSVATVVCDFKGIPTGSAVNIDVTP